MRSVQLGLLMLLGMSGAVVLLTSTPWGIGVWHDSVFYLDSSQNLASGLGLQWIGSGGTLKPLTHYPPLYPVVLSLLSATGASAVEAARWLAAVLYGVNIFLAAVLLGRATESKGLAIIGGVFALTSPILLDVHLEAMSEPLYLVSMLLCLGSQAEYLLRGKRWMLWSAAIWAAVAYLTRYVGISLVVAGGIALLVWPGRTIRRRAWDALAFGGVSLLPAAAWSASNALIVGSATNRVWSYHPVQVRALREAADAISAWLFPRTMGLTGRSLLTLLVGAAFVGVLLLTVRRLVVGLREERQFSDRDLLLWVGLLLWNALVYILALLFSMSFLDASTRLNTRILSPVYWMAFLMAGLLIREIPIRLRPAKPVAILLAVIALAAGLSYALRSAALLTEMRENGRGFSGRAWRTSETIRWLNELDREWLVYTNEAFPVRYLTGLPVYAVPEAFDPVQSRQRVDFETQIAEMADSLDQPFSMLLLFKGRLADPETTPIEAMVSGLVRVVETQDAYVYVSEANVAAVESP